MGPGAAQARRARTAATEAVALGPDTVPRVESGWQPCRPESHRPRSGAAAVVDLFDSLEVGSDRARLHRAAAALARVTRLSQAGGGRAAAKPTPQRLGDDSDPTRPPPPAPGSGEASAPPEVAADPRSAVFLQARDRAFAQERTLYGVGLPLLVDVLPEVVERRWERAFALAKTEQGDARQALTRCVRALFQLRKLLVARRGSVHAAAAGAPCPTTTRGRRVAGPLASTPEKLAAGTARIAATAVPNGALDEAYDEAVAAMRALDTPTRIAVTGDSPLYPDLQLNVTSLCVLARLIRDSRPDQADLAVRFTGQIERFAECVDHLGLPDEPDPKMHDDLQQILGSVMEAFRGDEHVKAIEEAIMARRLDDVEVWIAATAPRPDRRAWQRALTRAEELYATATRLEALVDRAWSVRAGRPAAPTFSWLGQACEVLRRSGHTRANACTLLIVCFGAHALEACANIRSARLLTNPVLPQDITAGVRDLAAAIEALGPPPPHLAPKVAELGAALADLRLFSEATLLDCVADDNLLTYLRVTVDQSEILIRRTAELAELQQGYAELRTKWPPAPAQAPAPVAGPRPDAPALRPPTPARPGIDMSWRPADAEAGASVPLSAAPPLIDGASPPVRAVPSPAAAVTSEQPASGAAPAGLDMARSPAPRAPPSGEAVRPRATDAAAPCLRPRVPRAPRAKAASSPPGPCALRSWRRALGSFGAADLALAEKAFDRGTFTSAVESAAYHFGKHARPSQSFASYVASAQRAMAGALGLVVPSLSDPLVRHHAVMDDHTYLVFTRDRRIVTYHDHR